MRTLAMNISDLELFRIELPARSGPIRTLLIRLVVDSGIEGWGETRHAWRPGELAPRRKSLLSVLAGREAFDVEAILALDALADSALACAVETALWDLIARNAKQPLSHLFGGSYRPSVPVSVRLPDGGPDEVAQFARAFSAQAIASQTITATGLPADDVKLLTAAREACGDRVQFRLDGRGRYALEDAVRLCGALEAGSVQFVLDPLADASDERIEYVRHTARVPLGAFETVRRPADVARLARAGAASYVVVDPVRVGGLARARDCAVVADAAGIASALQCEGTSGLALAASLQLAAATPGFIGGHACSYPMLHDDILVERLRMVDGMLTVPSAAGLGVEIDRDKLERYQAAS